MRKEQSAFLALCNKIMENYSREEWPEEWYHRVRDNAWSYGVTPKPTWDLPTWVYFVKGGNISVQDLKQIRKRPDYKLEKKIHDLFEILNGDILTPGISALSPLNDIYFLGRKIISENGHIPKIVLDSQSGERLQNILVYLDAHRQYIFYVQDNDIEDFKTYLPNYESRLKHVENVVMLAGGIEAKKWSELKTIFNAPFDDRQVSEIPLIL